MNPEVVNKLMLLFNGLPRAYGKYSITGGVRGDNKVEGRATTVRGEVNIELWEKHLNGEGIGIIPIRDDNCVYFGAIDIDNYSNFSHIELIKKINKLNLPLVCCSSKSGGAHLFCFVKQPVEATIMVKKLREFAALLGIGTNNDLRPVEIFPKQTKILSERGDIGHWINMPYCGENSNRVAFDENGKKLSLEEFVDYAKQKQITNEQLKNFVYFKNEETGDFNDGPPCLKLISELGMPNGTRNDGLYNFGIYAQKKYPDEWENKLIEYNQKLCNPNLTLDELNGIIKSLKKKTYGYSCKKQPICSFCNIDVCKNKQFGIKKSLNLPEFGTLTKLNTNPAIWFLDIEDHRIQLTTDELQSPLKFQKICIEHLHIMPVIPEKKEWSNLINNALQNVVVVDVPKESSTEGQLLSHLESFFLRYSISTNKNDLFLGKTTKIDNYIYFSLTEFMSYLTKINFKEFKPHEITGIFKRHNIDSKALATQKETGERTSKNFWRIKENQVNLNNEIQIPEILLQKDEDIF